MRPELMVVADRQTMALLADPLKAEILREMNQAQTTAELAQLMDMPRQKLGYHVRQLEEAGLLLSVGESRRGNCVARQLQAVARHFVISKTDADNGVLPGRFSSNWLVEQSARTIREIGLLSADAAAGGKQMQTVTLDAEIAFDNLQEQQAFSQELNEMICALVARYGSDSSAARRFRVLAASYPRPPGE
jgi:DNA-binding transcriptional ArsR family regulator